jgi:hypothetical protein
LASVMKVAIVLDVPKKLVHHNHIAAIRAENVVLSVRSGLIGGVFVIGVIGIYIAPFIVSDNFVSL